MSATISDPARRILETVRVEENKVFLTCGQIERGLYQEVDKVLQKLGGKWKGGKTAAHVFDSDPVTLLSDFLSTGIKPDLNSLSYFATKKVVCDKLTNWIRLESSYFCLDADAGEGAIASSLKEKYPSSCLHLVELDPKRAEVLRDKRDGGRYLS